jgi:hypothetical protein
LSGPVIAGTRLERLLASLEAPHLHPELIAANQLVGQHVAQPGLQQQDADNIAHKSRDNQQQARQRQHHATHHLAAGHLPQLHLLLGSEQSLDPSLRTSDDPSTAVSTSKPTVGKAPITEPTLIMTVSSSNTSPTNNSNNLPIATSER